MHNDRIPWMRLKPQVSPRVTKEVNPLYLSPTAVGVDENTRELYIYTKQLIAWAPPLCQRFRKFRSKFAVPFFTNRFREFGKG